MGRNRFRHSIGVFSMRLHTNTVPSVNTAIIGAIGPLMRIPAAKASQNTRAARRVPSAFVFVRIRTAAACIPQMAHKSAASDLAIDASPAITGAAASSMAAAKAGVLPNRRQPIR